MKILQINVVYKYGSTGNIVYDLHNELIKNGYLSLVCFGRGEKNNEFNVKKIINDNVLKIQSLRSRITGYAYAGCFLSTLLISKLIKKEKPDVVHLHCLNGYFVNIYKLLDYLKKNNIKTVLTLHAEFMYTAGCGYALDCEKWRTGCSNCLQINKNRPKSWFFDRSAKEWSMMSTAFERFDNITIVPVSYWLYNRAILSPFLKDKKFKVITNGINTRDIFKPTDYSKIKKLYNITDEKIILHVTSNFLNPIKGGKYVLEIAKRFENDNVKIIIIGEKGNFLNFNNYNNIICIPYIKNQKELAQYYSMADLTLLTSKKETYSMVCAESLACGTPIVGFKAGAPETISIGKYSEFVKQDDIDTLEKTIRLWLNKKQEYGNLISNDAKVIYSKEEMYKNYVNLYNE